MLRDVIRGDIPFAIVNAPSAVGLVQGKKLRILAVVAKKRSTLFPDTPTLIEAFAAAGLPKLRPIREAALGLSAPAGIPSNVRQTLSTGFEAILKDPAVQEKLRRLSMEPTDWGGEQE
jgi:tripartite-type tricarboxylate transporter receptor subunit TctC